MFWPNICQRCYLLWVRRAHQERGTDLTKKKPIRAQQEVLSPSLYHYGSIMPEDTQNVKF
jgi:hypothetical protein